MNAYEKNIIDHHIWLYRNGCHEALNIVCPGALEGMLTAIRTMSVSSSYRNMNSLIYAMMFANMYPMMRKQL